MLERIGFLGEINPDRVFWSADQAILSLGTTFNSPKRNFRVGLHDLDPAQVVTRHEDHSEA
jgi:hypothetical protein